MLLKNFWLFFLWMVVILYLSFTPLSGWPKLGLFQKLYFDKLVHISMYAILAFLLLWAVYRFNHHAVLRTSVIISCIVFCALMGASIEFLQPILTQFRQFEWLDMMANATGSICGYFLFLLIRKQWHAIEPDQRRNRRIA